MASERTNARRSGKEPADERSKRKKRVTFVMLEDLDNLLEIFCNATGQQKNHVANGAINDYLLQHREELHEALLKTRRSMEGLSPSSGEKS